MHGIVGDEPLDAYGQPQSKSHNVEYTNKVKKQIYDNDFAANPATATESLARGPYWSLAKFCNPGSTRFIEIEKRSDLDILDFNPVKGLLFKQTPVTIRFLTFHLRVVLAYYTLA